MLQRPKFPRHKKVLIINDVPVKAEVNPRTKEDTYGDKFSAKSNLDMLTAFRKGTLDIYSKGGAEKLPGITQKDIYTTYLDMSYFGEPDVEKNFDFYKEFKKRKDLIEDIDNNCLVDRLIPGSFYRKLEHQKDVYISERLSIEFNALLEEIKLVSPEFIIVTGKWSLFFLTGCTSLTQNQGNATDRKPFGGLAKFRSSILHVNEVFGIDFPHILMPMYHPVNSITMPDKAYIMDLDIQKICWMFEVMQTEGVEYFIKPDKELIIGDSLSKIFLYMDTLLALLDTKTILVSIDIETFFSQTIDCIGFAYEIDRAICIPLATKTNPSLWAVKDEIDILCKIREVLLHPNCLHIGQNYSYEQQFYTKLWGIKVQAYRDTMVLSHVLRNYMPKDLAFLASLYTTQYCYWKDMQVHK